MYKKAIVRPFNNLEKLWPIMVVMIINMIVIAVFRRFYFDYGVLVGFVVTSILSILPLSYYLKSVQPNYYRRRETPEWENLTNMLYKGFVAFLGILLYLFPLIVLMVFAEYLSTHIYLFAVLYAIFLLYVLPAILVNYTRTYEFSDMFNLSYILWKVSTLKYFLAFVFGLFWFLFLNILILIPYLGTLLFLITKPAATLTCFTLIAKVMHSE